MNDRLGMSFVQALALLVACAITGGLAALVAVLLCYFLLNFGGVESADKHGISSMPAVRIGGVLIVGYLVLNLLFQRYSLALSTLNADSSGILVGALPFFVLGFYEDLRSVLSPRFRFIAMFMIAAGLVIMQPAFVLLPVNQSLIDGALLNHYWTATIFTVLCLAFLPNAFNTADGANGLVSGLSLVAALLLASVAPQVLVGFLNSVAVACLLFLIYNLSTGRFFLGDGGAYFLGALLGLGLIVVSNSTAVSVWYLATLVFYPVADLAFSMVRRAAVGRAPFSADDEHLHNLLFMALKQRMAAPKYANTLTGLLIVGTFSGSTALIYGFELMAPQSDAWLAILVLFWCIYVLSWRELHKRRVKVAL